MRLLCCGCVFQRRVLLDGCDYWHDILRFLSRKNLAILQRTCADLNEIITTNFAEKPLHILKWVKIYESKKGKLKFYDIQQRKKIKLNTDNLFPLPGYLRFEKFLLRTDSSFVQNFVENGGENVEACETGLGSNVISPILGVQKIGTALRNSHFTFLYNLDMVQTRQQLTLYIRRHLFECLRSCKIVGIRGPLVPRFLSIEEEPDPPILRTLLYEFNHVEMELSFAEDGHCENFRRLWEQSLRKQNKDIPPPGRRPYSYETRSALAQTFDVDEIFVWLHGERLKNGEREQQRQGNEEFLRTLKVYDDSFNLSYSTGMFDQFLVRLKEHFINSMCAPVGPYKFHVVLTQNTRDIPKSAEFLMHNSIGEQLSMEILEDPIFADKHLIIKRQHSMFDAHKFIIS